LSWTENLNAEAQSALEVPPIMCDDSVTVASHCRLQDEVVLGIGQMRPLKIEDLLKLCFRTKVVKKGPDFRQGDSGWPGARQSLLILKHKRNR
jgi:hypothetical protein